MPHVGGGSNSGGFSSSSSGTSSTPRTDVYGNTHSNYYYRPGFYYGGMYVPYSRVNRGFNAVKRYFILLVIGLVFAVAGVLIFFNTGDSTKLEEYSIDRYNTIYSDYNYNESNIMIEIVAYDELTKIDYLPIVGDNVSYSIDELFGNQYSLFGGIFADNLSKTEYKVTNLYSVIALSLSEVNDTLSTKYFTKNDSECTIVNNTSFEINGYDALIIELNEFYSITGYAISVDVSNTSDVYKPNYGPLIGFSLLGIAIIVIGIIQIVKSTKAVKKINEAEKNGTAKNYYEGEVDYDEQIKSHPIDEPYRYDFSEYDKLRKKHEKEKQKKDKDKYDLDF